MIVSYLRTAKIIVFNIVFVKQTLTITTYLERVEIKNCWWFVIKVFAILGWGTIISGIALIIIINVILFSIPYEDTYIQNILFAC